MGLNLTQHIMKFALQSIWQSWYIEFFTIAFGAIKMSCFSSNYTTTFFEKIRGNYHKISPKKNFLRRFENKVWKFLKSKYASSLSKFYITLVVFWMKFWTLNASYRGCQITSPHPRFQGAFLDMSPSVRKFPFTNNFLGQGGGNLTPTVNLKNRQNPWKSFLKMFC